jgi:hypothetical protein
VHSGVDSATQTQVLNTVHLELLHNYATLTSYTLSPVPILRNLWRINVPQLGLSHEFVMRGVLALSAMHLSHSSPDKRDYYLSVAAAEHNAALPAATGLLHEIDDANCSALYIFSTLTFLYSLASPREPGNLLLTEGAAKADWLVFLHGVRHIGESFGDQLLASPFGILFTFGQRTVQSGEMLSQFSQEWRTTTEHAALSELRQLVSSTVSDTHKLAVYQDSLDSLETSFCAYKMGQLSDSPPAIPSAPGMLATPVATPTSLVYSWLYRLTDDFVELVSKREPEALTIFAHYCVLLKAVDGYWWMTGWSAHLLREIWAALGHHHRLWVRWPIEEVGWTPMD